MKQLLATVTTLLLFATSITAQTYVVNTTMDDADDGDCIQGLCTLREALKLAESDGVPSVIEFDIDSCPNDSCTIDLISTLEIVSEGDLVIDGTTQAFNYPMDSRIILNTRNIESSATTTILIATPNVEVYGLHITDLGVSGIVNNGIEIYDSEVTIGAKDKGNIIERTNEYGIYVDDGLRDINIQYNAIGTGYDKSLGGILPMMDYGIYAGPSITNLKINNNLISYQEVDGIYSRASGTQITNNEICFNAANAVSVDDSANENLIQGNSMYCNLDGIVLNGIANDGISLPTIFNASQSLIEGTAGADETVEVFISDNTDCVAANCQGKQLIGRIFADDNGNWELSLPYILAPDTEITATTTDGNGNTSEFASCIRVSIDDCPQAALLPINSDPCGRISITASLEATTAYSPSPVGVCASTFGDSDIWFKVLVPSTGNLLIKQHDNTNINATIEAYTSCPTFASTSTPFIKCQDMSLDPNVMTLTGQVAGSTIYLRVWEQNDIIVDGAGIATVELSAHELDTDPANWELCDTPMAQGIDNNSGFGGGRKKANEFILQYNADATPSDINLMTNQLLAMGATLRDQCECADPVIQLWAESDPVTLEVCKKAAAKKKSRVDTTNFNYIIEDLDCQEIQTSLNTLNAMFEANIDDPYQVASGNLIYEFADNITGSSVVGYYEYDISGTWLSGQISGFLEGYPYTATVTSITYGSLDIGVLSGTLFDQLGQPITTLTGTAEVNSSNIGITNIDITAIITEYQKVPCAVNCALPAYQKYSPSNSASSSVIVGVSDTGIDTNSGEFSTVSWTNPDPDACVENDLNGYNFASNNENFRDTDGHGSKVSSTIMNGFPSDINLDIMPLKFYENGRGTVFDGICSIHYATDKGADILNLSWGFESEEYPEILYDAMENASCSDILIVTSAGNRKLNNDEVQKWPANFDLNNIITVASYDDCDGELKKADFSNFGANSVDIAANGFSSTIPFFGAEDTESAGTSISTPIVTQAAAIIKARYPTLSAFDIRDCILSTVQVQPLLESVVASKGILDLNAAVNCAQTKANADAGCASLGFIANVVNEVCWGKNGSIDLIITGGKAPYNYQWSNGATTGLLSNIPAGCYRLDVIDGNGCRGTFSIEVEHECGVSVAPKVFLQGAFNASQPVPWMNSDLGNNQLLPSNEPYGTGQDELFVPPVITRNSSTSGYVDWVLVQLRDEVNPSQIVASRAAILSQSGDVVDMDGFSPVKFGEVPAGNYYVAIVHRNHLAVMSATIYTFSN